MDSEKLLYKYLNDSLSPEEQLAFDALLTTDENFAEEVAFQKDIKTVLAKEDYENTKQQLQAFETAYKAFPLKRIMIAASFALLVSISALWYFMTNQPTTEELFATYFEPYRNVEQPVVRGSQDDDLKTVAFKAYENGEYKEALQSFNQLLEQGQDDTVLFYKANTLLKLDMSDTAISLLKDGLDTSDPRYDKKLWYMAMGYLKLNNKQQAKQKLRLLLATKSKYKEIEATKLLQDLE